MEPDVSFHKPLVKYHGMIGFQGISSHIRRSGQGVAIVHRVEMQAETDLTQVIDAGCALRRCLGSRQSRKQQRCEDRDDGNDDQQLDQGEPRFSVAASFHKK